MVCSLPLFLALCFVCYKQFLINYVDEWTGRGLYPGLAFFHGFDLYSPGTGPHVTLYGWATGMFYSLCGFANNPIQAISIANNTNLLSLIVILLGIFWNLFKYHLESRFFSIFLTILTLCLVVFISLTDLTTFCIFKIHADWPAMSFILVSLIFFRFYILNKKNVFLLLTSIFLVLSAWAKLPTLPALLFPLIYFLIDKSFKSAFQYFLLCLASLLSSIIIVGLSYGFYDTYFILFDHISDNKWSDRNSLFDGKGTPLIKMSYFDATPLLLRFLSMYINEYWYLCLSSCLCLVTSFSKLINSQNRFIFRTLSIIYFLTLPACLAAVAHFGSVENSLFFANFSGVLCLVSLTLVAVVQIFNLQQSAYILLFITYFSCLPSLRQARSINTSSLISPHQQAFDYLESGKKDVYFGWYPVSHLLHSSKNYSCIEVPTWVGMTKPKLLKFGLNHIPNNAKFLATSPTGYGSTILKQYIGDLVEVPAPDELSSWRLYEIKALSTVD